jgi:tubulysin polyketide synthase-like protein
MSGAASLLRKLREAGILIRSDGGRLIVEAPVGVVTAEMRGDLARHKKALVAVLESSVGNLLRVEPVSEALREVGGLLAVAYRRYASIPRVPKEPRNPTLKQLALSKGVSVHGHGRVP